MSKAETIAKLESLLDRVRSRATEPRTPATAVRAAASDGHAAPSPAPSLPLPLPPPPPPATPAPPVATESDLFVEVDVQETVGDTVIGVAEDAVVADASESRERLVAAEPVTEVAVLADAPTNLSIETASPDELAAEEDVQEAPASSRRPVAPEPEERLAEIAFGAEEPRPPRHTPPPESGRLPAAPVVDFDGDVTGVRDATPIAEPRRPRELVPEPTPAELAPSDAVADVVLDAQRFAPQTFVALLDASIAL